jgi:hypothetical protein
MILITTAHTTAFPRPTISLKKILAAWNTVPKIVFYFSLMISRPWRCAFFCNYRSNSGLKKVYRVLDARMA